MTRCVVACVQAKEAARAANKEKFATLLTDLHTAGVITHESRWVGTMEKPEMADDERFKVCAATALCSKCSDDDAYDDEEEEEA